MDFWITLPFCIFGNLIVTALLFHFMEQSYRRVYARNGIYYAAFGGVITLCVCVNLFDASLLLLLVWGAAAALCVSFLYTAAPNRLLQRIAACEALILYLTVCETGGAILIRFFLWKTTLSQTAQNCITIVFSDLTLILMYRLLVTPLLKRMARYVVHTLVPAYTLINLLEILHLSAEGQLNHLYLFNAGCIILTNLYLLYFLSTNEKKKRYENQVKELEQQAKLQYEYYLAQTRKQEQTMRILHDVDKHIRAIENLHTSERHNTAGEYAAQIGEILKPLIPTDYTDNPILNILLSDKETLTKEKGAAFRIQLSHVSLSFLQPIDVTTIFGNLLDNALEAVEKAAGERFISLKISSYHKMVVARMENSSPDVVWKNGMPLSAKGASHGLGLLNVQNAVKKYDGDLKLRQEDGRFIVEIFLSRPAPPTP